ncbi:MAG TPA: hypothetical protein VNE39_20600 [Planctomycetota bacterium]|nr:hypothetical protein [Planctomycetota bacterium]
MMWARLLCAFAAGLAAGAEGPWAARDQPDLKSLVERAKALAVEELGVPVTSVRRGELMLVPNPDGKTHDFLQWYFKGYGGPTTVFIGDLATGAVKRDGIPDRRQIHICGRVLGPDGKLYIATPDWQKGMEVYVYDPATNELSCKGVVAPGLAGETRPMCIGTDGMIYGSGSYNQERKAGAYQIDPKTGKVTEYGPIGPSHAPNGCWGYSVAADDRYVYVASGKVPWFLVAYDRQTGKDETLVTTETVGGYVGVSQQRHGCTASASKVVGTDGKAIQYWLYQGKAIPKKAPNEKPPWPEPPDSKPWVGLPPKPEFFTDSATPTSDGKAALWYRTPETKAEDREWKAIPLQVPTYPMTINRLTELPDGRVLGTADSYEGNFLFDPATGKSVHLGKNHLSHYATAILDGKVYMSGYPSSITYVLDPAKPWTIGSGDPVHKPIPETDERSNPRLLGYLNKWAGTHKMYAAAVGADGKVYFGGRWVRNGSGGGLAWWDPQKGEGGGFWREFSNCQITHMAAAEGGGLIVISTMRVRDATLGKPEPKQGKLFVWDTAAQKLVREIEPVMEAKGTALIVSVGGSRVLGWTEDPADPKSSILYGVDASSGEVAFRKKLPFPLPVGIGSNQMEPFDFRLGPDGKVWTFLAGALIRINPADAAIEVLGKIPGGRLAFSGGNVYLSGSAQLRRVRGPAAKE